MICAIGLSNPKNSFNVGSVLRASKAFDVSLLVITGRGYKKASTDTSDSTATVPLIHTDDLFDTVPYNCIPVAVEYTDESTCLTDFLHPENAFYIFGPEDGSIPQRILDKCKYTVKIPTNICLNLATSVSILLYDRVCKQKNKQKLC